MAKAAVVMRNNSYSPVLTQNHRQPLLAMGATAWADGKPSRCRSSAVSLATGRLAELSCVHSEKCLLSLNLVPSRRKACPRRTFNVIRAATKVKSPAEVDWKSKRDFLLRKKVRSVSPKEALKLQQEQNYKIVDVRPEREYNEAHPAGALNAQVYRLIKDWTLWDISRRVAFAFFGIFQGTEENPAFLDDIKKVLGKDDKIILACVAGGTLKPTPNLAEGSQSRSLIAAYLLALEGFTNIAHLEGGLKEWFKQNLPLEGDSDD